jgi:glycosyltransferase involved in cell wall biosynthesis
MRKLSVVIPVYNGAATIGRLVEAVLSELSAHDPEVVLVNDGSRDNSEDVCTQLALSHPSVKFISLRRNFGEHNAVMCGLNHADAEFVAIIDDDFQNPPSEIEKLLREAEKGYDVVYSRYRVKQHSWFRNSGSRAHNWLATIILDKPRDLYLSSFRVMSRDLVQEVIKYRGPFPYIDGLILRVTNNIGTCLVEHQPRAEGRSNYTLGKLVSLSLNMFLNFSVRPLRFFTAVGFALFVLGIVLSIYYFIWKIFNPDYAVGWASLMIATLTLSGVQLLFLGLIGEYLGKNYLDRNGAPQYVIKKKVP